MTGNICEMLYEHEKQILSEYAFFTRNTKGREYPIKPCHTRTEFQRDRDRIIHSKSFRRLMHKTQVFLSPEKDHYRTRLTHTLEVTQIARTIARALRLNEDLCEAVALGHDLGHTPFGHAGERVLRRCYDENFAHYKQSLRVVEKLENLNLTHEVRDGILCHTLGGASTLEGRIVKFADHIAYINHDIDDACRAKIMKSGDIPKEIRKSMGESHGERIDCMVNSIIEASSGRNEIAFDPIVDEMTNKLYKFLFDNVYTNPIAKGEESKAEALLESLYKYFIKNSDKLPEEYSNIIKEEGI
ncbi:MAG: deoxyguanosinetriphosphate triphosphohydrolase, partial [Oscillospiraceae bacterium]|nr:deoxyguanosinetriphosphate triphosphohydrolase [Oscillospiraceae bacterium]